VTLSFSQIKDASAFAHYDLRFVKPLDEKLLHHIFKTYKAVIVFEEGVKQGGAGSALLEFASLHQYKITVIVEGVSDNFVAHGKPADLLAEVGLDEVSISKKLDLLLNNILG